MEEFQIDNHRKYDRSNSEEVQDIIDRMPTRFGWWITGIVLSIVALLLFFGWLVRYPDVVTGEIVVNTSISPVKLVANSSGKLKIRITRSQSVVKEGEIIAYIQNTASLDTLGIIKNILKGYDPNKNTGKSVLESLPKEVSLGQLTSQYYTFLANLQQWENFNEDKLYDQQILGLVELFKQQEKEVENSRQRLDISRNNLFYAHKFYQRDSILFQKEVIAEAELDQAKLSYLNSKSSYQSVYSLQINSIKESKQTKAEIDQARIQESEKREEIKLALVASYNDLKNGIKKWEDDYIFKAPFDGRVQFLNFWTDGQFIQAGQPVFTAIPENKELYGQVMLPAMGAGKVTTGQEAIIKLNDFPYMEYGSVKGTVEAISLTTSTGKTAQGSMETYLVTVRLDSGLMTNYGKKLPFKQEARGIAEIITKDRRLVERLFDNLKYVIKDN